MDSAGERFEAICAALADRNNILTVKDLYELAGVSRSGYYNWVRSEKNRELREAKDRAAFEQILEAYRFRGYAKGVRGIHMRLLHMGIRMNVKKIRRLMRKYKLTCPIRSRIPTADCSDPSEWAAPRRIWSTGNSSLMGREPSS